MEILKLENIRQGMPGVSPTEGANLYENCIVQLHRSRHRSPVSLHVDGAKTCTYHLAWEGAYSDTIGRTYADEQSCVERAAVSVSILLALQQTPYTIIERARRGTGFDYMLGDKNDIFFLPKARLEVSGISKETHGNTIGSRFKGKKAQVEKAHYMAELPAYVSIVEFSTPKAKFDTIE